MSGTALAAHWQCCGSAFILQRVRSTFAEHEIPNTSRSTVASQGVVAGLPSKFANIRAGRQLVITGASDEGCVVVRTKCGERESVKCRVVMVVLVLVVVRV
ncbi:hypothetical protein E2C01_007989 [Portunus trituberculatus]|uniref:Uncharacterized protein n=1 Tax=Portunus trituberculatus TaxID=210409 RepID=A0A5B7D2Q3_PORTR|nr:hypothetical protein [Portunus trituberculatus]